MVSDCRLAIRTYGLSGRSSPPALGIGSAEVL